MRIARRSRPLVVLSLVLLAACAQAEPDRPQIADAPPDAEQYYYAIEMNGTLAGYSHLVAYPAEVDGRQLTVMRQKIFVLLNLLGAEFNQEIDQVFEVDPNTGMAVSTRADVRQGPSHFEWSAKIDGDVAHLHSTVGGGDRTVSLPPGTIVPNPLTLTHLERDFLEGGAERRTYDLLDVREAKVRKVEYTRVAEETVELRGRSWNTVVIDEDHVDLGVKLRMWIDRDSAMVLQVDMPGQRRVYLAEPRVVRSIQVANITENIASRVGVMIPDYQSISHMKVRATFEPSGLRVTSEMLNVPGQTFEGTVEGNRVEGVFEIAHPRYDGAGAPAFPIDLEEDQAVRAYLEPSMGVESDDPVLIAHARQLTEGATDAWDAATRISAWVSDEIEYAIPGGGTARRTFDERAGECGSHSALVAALCRAVGIPARVVWGCQYIPNFGGAFGQHGWNEIYLGKRTGWIPIDATSREVDYVDAGHIRIGELQSAATALNPVEAKILAYRLGNGEPVVLGETAAAAPDATGATDAIPERYRPYVGAYRGPRGTPFRVAVDHDTLVVHVGEQTALPLLEPDAEGIWRCKLTPNVYVRFDRDDAGAVTTMWVHEIAHMRKTTDAAAVPPDTPPALRDHLGTYLLTQVNQEFTAVWRKGALAIRQGNENDYATLRGDPDRPGTWISQATGNRITFDTDPDGKVTGLTVDAASKVNRN